MATLRTVPLAARSPPPDTANASSALTQLYEDSFESLRNLVGCKICIKPMYEPYTISCGHTFCYSCLAQWFSNHKANKTCPECRAKVIQQPAPSYVVREMTQIFLSRAELMPDGETTDEHKKAQEEEASLVEKDRTNITPRAGGLFRGCFAKGFDQFERFRPGRLIRDAEDGVTRCPICAWELEDGWCNACGVDFEGEEDMASVTNLSESDIPDGYDEYETGPTDNLESESIDDHELLQNRIGEIEAARAHRQELTDGLATADTDYSDISNDTDLDGFVVNEGDPWEDGSDNSSTLGPHMARAWPDSETATILSDSEEDHSTLHEGRDRDVASGHESARLMTASTQFDSDSESSAARGDGDESQSDTESEVQLPVNTRGSRKRQRVLSDDSDDDDDEDAGFGGEAVHTVQRSRSRRPRLSNGENAAEQESWGNELCTCYDGPSSVRSTTAQYRGTSRVLSDQSAAARYRDDDDY